MVDTISAVFILEDYMKMMDSMMQTEAVSNFAEEIEGITVRIKNGAMEVLGIGRLRFNNY